MKRLLLVLISFTLFFSAYSQTEKEVKSLVFKWSDANNNQDLQAYRSIYGPRVLFYGKYKTAEECVALKAGFFRNHSDYTDKVTDLEIDRYKSAIIKCSFQKSVKYFGYNKTYPSYLLLEKQDGILKIVGESDEISDNKIGFVLNLGEKNTKSISGLIMVAGIIILSIFIFVFYLKNRKKPIIKQGNPPIPQNEHFYPDVSIPKNLNSQIEKSENKGGEFEKYITSLFDPRYFNLLHWQSDKYHNGIYPESNKDPDLVYEYSDFNYSAQFAIECKYRSSFKNNTIELAKTYQLDNYRRFEHISDRAVFIVLGVGGTPSDPDSLYIIPLEFVHSCIWTREELAKYYRKKKGNFFLQRFNMELQ